MNERMGEKNGWTARMKREVKRIEDQKRWKEERKDETRTAGRKWGPVKNAEQLR